MRRIEINIHEKGICRQVGYLERLYQDARSTEHKMLYILSLQYILILGHTRPFQIAPPLSGFFILFSVIFNDTLNFGENIALLTDG
jgi:hypothetical protein